MSSALEAYFKKIVVINLDHRTDRWAGALEELALANITDYERVSGFPHPVSGNAGCTRTHVALWRRIAEGPDEHVLVLEDDFYQLTLPRMMEGGFTPFARPIQIFQMLGGNLDDRFDILSKHFPADWDVLYLGAGYGAPPLERVNKHMIRTSRMMTTSSYAITREFAKRVSTQLSKWLMESHPEIKDHSEWYWGPIDSLLGGFADNNKFYCVQPRLFIQRPSKSDLTGRDEYYLFSMTDSAHEDSI